MKYILLFFFIGLDFQYIVAQSLDSDTIIYLIVEQSPEFPGGQKALNDYLKNNLQYPQEEINNNKQGKVIVSFIIWTDGSIRKVEVDKSLNANLDKEAMRLISTMPRWKSGMQGGKTVPCAYKIPVVFKLDENQNNQSTKRRRLSY